MPSEIYIYKYSSHEVRIIFDEQDPVNFNVVAKDLARVLNKFHTRKITKEVDNDYLHYLPILEKGEVHILTCIEKAGALLLFKNHESFRTWLNAISRPADYTLINSDSSFHSSKLYVLKNLETNLVKIGVTSNITRRMNELQNSSGCHLVLMYLSPELDKAYELESKLHEFFSAARGLGEWFRVDADRVITLLSKLHIGTCIP